MLHSQLFSVIEDRMNKVAHEELEVRCLHVLAEGHQVLIHLVQLATYRTKEAGQLKEALPTPRHEYPYRHRKT